MVDYVIDQTKETFDKNLAAIAMDRVQEDMAQKQIEAQAAIRNRAELQRINQPDLKGLTTKDLTDITKAMKEQGMDLEQLHPDTPEDVRQEMLQLAAKVYDPLLKEDELMIAPGPMGFGAVPTTGRLREPLYDDQGNYIGEGEPYYPAGRLKNLYEEHKLDAREFLKSKGISTDGASYPVQRDITRIPPSMPDSYARVITEPKTLQNKVIQI